MGFNVPQKKLYDAFVAEEGVDGYRLNHTMKTYDQMTELGVKLKRVRLLSTRVFYLEAQIYGRGSSYNFLVLFQ